MNGLDYAVIAVIAVGALAGLFQGVLGMGTSIASLGAGFYAASAHYGRAAAIAHLQLGVGPEAAAVIGFAAMFVAAFAAVQIVGLAAIRLLNLIHLGWLDGIAGAAIGAAIAAIIAGVCVMLMTAILPADAALIRNSQLAPMLLAADERLISLIPPEAKQIYQRKRDELIKYWVANAAKQAARQAAPTPSPSPK